MNTENRETQELVKRFFATGGPASRGLEDFRERPEQQAMAVAVEEAIRQKQSLIVEAGTGVGKSLGYLVPALICGLASQRRVVVSTQTLSLQDQLVSKDIPFLTKNLGFEFRAELAKGRNNYMAPRRYSLALEAAEGTLQAEEHREELFRIRAQLDRSREGTRQELRPSAHPELWEQIQSEHGNCLGKACQNFKEACYYHQARRRMQSADLIVVNHSLFMADLAMRAGGGKIIPDYDIVIFDEAHTLESVAVDHFGFRLTRRMMTLFLGRLYDKKRRRGIFQHIHSELGQRARDVVAALRFAVNEFFDSIIEYCDGLQRVRELTNEDLVLDTLSEPIAELLGVLADLQLSAGSAEKEIEFRSYGLRCEEFLKSLDFILKPKNRDAVHWAECGANRFQVALFSRPLEVSEQLRTELFDQVGTVILTSATMATGRDHGLDFIAKKLGGEQCEQLTLGSPFDYQRQVKMRIPVDLGDPNRSPEYAEAAAGKIFHYLKRTQGATFVLFTSYEFMGQIKRRLEADIEAEGWPLLVQGEDMSREIMVQEFREAGNAVLFGTDSFWQGVDVRGDALRQVIITRLPFAVPTQPWQKGRADQLSARGGNAFRDLSLPEALIRFKQGFGRLIRTEDDTGTFVVLDNRVLSKSYGRQFIDVIPDMDLFRDSELKDSFDDQG